MIDVTGTEKLSLTLLLTIQQQSRLKEYQNRVHTTKPTKYFVLYNFVQIFNLVDFKSKAKLNTY